MPKEQSKSESNPEAKAAKKQYRVVQPLRHDGKHYVPGKHVALTAAQAKGLIEGKVVAASVDAEDAGE